MGQTADDLRSDIEQRRENMSGTVDAIEDRVVPRRIIDRRKRAARGWLGSTRARVMGSSREIGDRVSETTGSMTSGAQHMAEEITDAPAQVMEQTRGAPLIAGGVAFGIGALLALVLPESEPEHRMAEKMAPQLAAATDAAKQAGTQTLETAKSSAQEAVGELKDVAKDHVQDVAGQAKTAAEEVKSSATSQSGEARQS